MLFYDTCSFRYHVNARGDVSEKIIEFMYQQDGIVIISRGILMELSSVRKKVNPEYVRYIRKMSRYGLLVYVIYEEDLFEVMSFCYSTNEKINSLLMWAVRTMKGPVSTITTLMEQNPALADIILKGKNLDNRNIFKKFFSTLRSNKEPQDDLLTLLQCGSKGNLKILGTRIYDLKSTEISLSSEELADQLLKREVHITF